MRRWLIFFNSSFLLLLSLSVCPYTLAHSTFLSALVFEIKKEGVACPPHTHTHQFPRFATQELTGRSRRPASLPEADLPARPPSPFAPSLLHRRLAETVAKAWGSEGASLPTLPPLPYSFH